MRSASQGLAWSFISALLCVLIFQCESSRAQGGAADSQKTDLASTLAQPYLNKYEVGFRLGLGSAQAEPHGNGEYLLGIEFGMYLGTIGINALYDDLTYGKPTRGMWSRSWQVTTGLRQSLFNNKCRIEPIVGYRWHELKRVAGIPYSSGFVAGVDQLLQVTDNVHMHAQFTHGFFDVSEQKYSFMTRVWNYAGDGRSRSPYDGSKGWHYLDFGLQLDMQGSQRKDWLIIFRAGGDNGIL